MVDLVVGDSYITGFELEEEIGIDGWEFWNWDEETKEKANNHRMKTVFHSKLFNKLNRNYTTLSKVGASNQWIAYSLIHYLDKVKHYPQNVVVCWTANYRIDKMYKDTDFVFNPLYSNSADLPHGTSWWEKLLVKIWFYLEKRFFFNINYVNYLNDMSVRLAQEYLENRGINYVFIKTIESDLDLRRFTKNCVNESFHEFAKPREFKQAKGGHYLSEAHSAWADHLYSEMKGMIINSKTLV